MNCRLYLAEQEHPCQYTGRYRIPYVDKMGFGSLMACTGLWILNQYEA